MKKVWTALIAFAIIAFAIVAFAGLVMAYNDTTWTTMTNAPAIAKQAITAPTDIARAEIPMPVLCNTPAQQTLKIDAGIATFNMTMLTTGTTTRTTLRNVLPETPVGILATTPAPSFPLRL